MLRKTKPQISYQFSAPFSSVQEFVNAMSQGNTMYDRYALNSDDTPQKWVITSVKTWKRDPNRIEVGFKRGMYQTWKAYTLSELNTLAKSYQTIEQKVLV